MATPAARPTTPSIGIATVSFGSDAVLGPFLRSIPAASSASVMTVVADNRPENPGNTVPDLCQAAEATYLAMPSNLGYGKAMNAAVAAMPASIRWVLISNPDVLLAAGTIDELVRGGESDPEVGAVGPAVRNEDGTVYPSARAIPSLRTGVGHALFSNLWAANPWTTAYLRDARGELTARDAGWLSGSCVLVRRTVFDELDGFDPRFFMYFEDVDLGNRIGKAGYRNLYWPTASITHSGAHSTTGVASDAMIRAHHTSARQFLATKYPGVVLWPVRVTLSVGLAVRSFLIRRRARAARNKEAVK
ncbi:MAG TPA: glycosyltransferase family 2 protein [Galbitalea sp.]|jgi:N-acetylglucosaminyl-diphospho-decaprenol L-rhamnosyltransferase|nr:glycosyltransferase family 2 protein [Galbitalea sp.]